MRAAVNTTFLNSTLYQPSSKSRVCTSVLATESPLTALYYALARARQNALFYTNSSIFVNRAQALTNASAACATALTSIIASYGNNTNEIVQFTPFVAALAPLHLVLLRERVVFGSSVYGASVAATNATAWQAELVAAYRVYQTFFAVNMVRGSRAAMIAACADFV